MSMAAAANLIQHPVLRPRSAAARAISDDGGSRRGSGSSDAGRLHLIRTGGGAVEPRQLGSGIPGASQFAGRPAGRLRAVRRGCIWGSATRDQGGATTPGRDRPSGPGARKQPVPYRPSGGECASGRLLPRRSKTADSTDLQASSDAQRSPQRPQRGDLRRHRDSKEFGNDSLSEQLDERRWRSGRVRLCGASAGRPRAPATRQRHSQRPDAACQYHWHREPTDAALATVAGSTATAARTPSPQRASLSCIGQVESGQRLKCRSEMPAPLWTPPPSAASAGAMAVAAATQPTGAAVIPERSSPCRSRAASGLRRWALKSAG